MFFFYKTYKIVFVFRFRRRRPCWTLFIRSKFVSSNENHFIALQFLLCSVFVCCCSLTSFSCKGSYSVYKGGAEVCALGDSPRPVWIPCIKRPHAEPQEHWIPPPQIYQWKLFSKFACQSPFEGSISVSCKVSFRFHFDSI